MANQKRQPKRETISSGATVCCVCQPLTFGSLFAGIGGIDLGFERAGLQCKWQVEIDEYAQRVLAKHWPTIRRHDDVRTWPASDTEPVDVIVGGFPCQDISYAGKGAGLEGERSGLFYQVMRIVCDMGPRYVVLENVAALLTRGMGDVLGSLASLGYDAEWDCIPAAAVGAPHIRDRVFIIARRVPDAERSGSLPGTLGGIHRVEESPGARDVNAQRLCRAVPDAEGDRCGTRGTRRTVGVGPRQEDATAMADANGERLAKRQSQRSNAREEFAAPQRTSWWDVEPDVGRVANGIPARVDRIRGLGNAVVPQVAEYIGRRIVEAENRVT